MFEHKENKLNELTLMTCKKQNNIYCLFAGEKSNKWTLFSCSHSIQTTFKYVENMRINRRESGYLHEYGGMTVCIFISNKIPVMMKFPIETALHENTD